MATLYIVIGSDYGAHEIEWSEPTAPSDVSATPSVEVLALRHIRINFGLNAITDDAIRTLSNYTVTPITSGADSVEVKKITGVDFDDPYLTYVDLEITKPTEGALYQVTVVNLTDDNEQTIINNTAQFLAHRTKTDSIIEGFPRTYSTTVEGTLRGILAAISLEDELIGGLENIDG